MRSSGSASASARSCFAAAAVTLTESSDPEGRQLDVPGPRRRAPPAIVAATFAVIEGENARLRDVVDRRSSSRCGGRSSSSSSLVERRVPDPVLKLEFFRNPTFTAANVVAFATNLSVFSVFFFTALYLQLISSFSGCQIALVFVVAGGRDDRRRPDRRPLDRARRAAGADGGRLRCSPARGLLLVDRQLTATTSVAALAWPLAIAGLGFGIALVTMTAAVLALVPPEQSGMAASTVNTSRELGGVFGVAVLGAVVNAQLTCRADARSWSELAHPAQSTARS